MALRVIIEPSYAKACERLGPDYRKQIKAFENRVQTKGLGPGQNPEKISRCSDDRFRSLRVNDDVRVIAALDPLTFYYVGHHEVAYEWARNHAFTAPVSGQGQLVVYDTQAVPQAVVPPVRPDPFIRFSDQYLCEAIGVPPKFLQVVRNLADGEAVLTLAEYLPDVVVDRLLSLYLGQAPSLPAEINSAQATPPPAQEPSDQVILSAETQAVLDLMVQQPRREWLAFASATQKRLARTQFEKPVLLTGAAGTGKSVVLLQRAAVRAKLGDSVLLLTTGRTLLESLRADLDLLANGAVWRSRVDVMTFHELLSYLRTAAAEADRTAPKGRIAYIEHVRAPLDQAADAHGGRSRAWYQDEWKYVLEPWAVTSLEGYLEVRRRGRGDALQPSQRRAEWPVFENAVARLRTAGFVPMREVVAALTADYRVASTTNLQKWDSVLVDEYQDFGPAQLNLLFMLALEPSGVFMAGDAGQRLYMPPLEAGDVGRNVLGRRLSRSYRTTEAIRRFVDVEMGLRAKSERSVGASAGGAAPEFHAFATDDDERRWVTDLCSTMVAEGCDLTDIGVMAPTKDLAARLAAALRASGLQVNLVKERPAKAPGISVLHYHLAKGLEYLTVVVTGATADSLNPAMFERMGEEQRLERQAIRHNVLYVALTRARERLVVTCAGQPPPTIARSGQFTRHEPLVTLKEAGAKQDGAPS